MQPSESLTLLEGLRDCCIRLPSILSYHSSIPCIFNWTSIYLGT